MKTHRRRSLMWIATPVLVLAAACGSDDDGATTPSAGPTTTVSSETTTLPDGGSSTTDGATTTSPTGEGTLGPDGCVDEFDPDADYFPEKVAPEHSTLWSVEYHGSYAVLSVPDSEFPDRPDLRYVLVRCGAPEPGGTGDLDGAQVFTVPVARTAENHNNALAMLEQIGVLGTLVGMSDAQLALADDPYMAELLAQANDPTGMAVSGDEVDYERTLGLEPDIIWMAGYGPGYTSVADAVDRGLPAVMVANRIEPEPLASAEWIKFVSVFYGVEATANARFGEIEAAYGRAAATVAGKLPADLDVAYLCIEPDNGCEFVYAHGAKSFNGTILETLGVGNPFAEGNDAANGQTFDYEDALGRAADADFFIDYELPDAVLATLEADSRFAQFAPFAEGNFITYVPENYAFCRFNLYVQVDIPITDFAIGLAPNLFPGQQGTCFARP